MSKADGKPDKNDNKPITNNKSKEQQKDKNANSSVVTKPKLRSDFEQKRKEWDELEGQKVVVSPADKPSEQPIQEKFKGYGLFMRANQADVTEVNTTNGSFEAYKAVLRKAEHARRQKAMVDTMAELEEEYQLSNPVPVVEQLDRVELPMSPPLESSGSETLSLETPPQSESSSRTSIRSMPVEDGTVSSDSDGSNDEEVASVTNLVPAPESVVIRKQRPFKAVPVEVEPAPIVIRDPLPVKAVPVKLEPALVEIRKPLPIKAAPIKVEPGAVANRKPLPVEVQPASVVISEPPPVKVKPSPMKAVPEYATIPPAEDRVSLNSSNSLTDSLADLVTTSVDDHASLDSSNSLTELVPPRAEVPDSLAESETTVEVAESLSDSNGSLTGSLTELIPTQEKIRKSLPVEVICPLTDVVSPVEEDASLDSTNSLAELDLHERAHTPPSHRIQAVQQRDEEVDSNMEIVNEVNDGVTSGSGLIKRSIARSANKWATGLFKKRVTARPLSHRWPVFTCRMPASCPTPVMGRSYSPRHMKKRSSSPRHSHRK